MKYSRMALAVSFALGSATAHAATFTVNSTITGPDNDPSTTTLVEALTAAHNAPGEDTILFDQSVNGQSFNLNSTTAANNTAAEIVGNLIIDGGDRNIILNNEGVNNRMLRLLNGTDANLTLRNLTVSSDSTVPGSFVFSDPSAVNNTHVIQLDNVTVRHAVSAGTSQVSALNTNNANVTIQDSHLFGMTTSGSGAVLNAGIDRGNTITINNSIFDANTATNPTPATSNGGVIFLAVSGNSATPTVNIDNSSFSRNNVEGSGSAIHVQADGSANTTMRIRQTTIAGNDSNINGAVSIFAQEGAQVDLSLENALIADNSSESSGRDLATNTSTSTVTINSRYSLVENRNLSNTTTFNNTNSVLDTDPQLDTIVTNQSPGAHFTLPASSPAVDAGSDTFLPPAQDFLNNSRNSGCTVDIGAVERQAVDGPTLTGQAAATFTLNAADQDQTLELGSAFTDAQTLSYSVQVTSSGGAPQTFTINSQTGQLTINATAAQLGSIFPVVATVTATDPTCLAASQMVTINAPATSSGGSSSSAMSPWALILGLLPFVQRRRQRRR